MQASNDSVVSVSNTDINNNSSNDGTRSRGGSDSGPSLFNSGVNARGRKYWAHRFFAFLSKLTELAAAVKDESALEEL